MPRHLTIRESLQIKKGQSRNTSHSSDASPGTITTDHDETLHLKGTHDLCKVGRFDSNAGAFSKASADLAPSCILSTACHLVKQAENSCLQLFLTLAISRAHALVEQAHVNSSLRIRCRCLQGGLNKPVGLFDVISSDCLSETHFCVCFSKTNHGLELTSRGSNALLSSPDILSHLAHLDIVVNQSLSRLLRDGRVACLTGIRDIRSEELDVL